MYRFSKRKHTSRYMSSKSEACLPVRYSPASPSSTKMFPSCHYRRRTCEITLPYQQHCQHPILRTSITQDPCLLLFGSQCGQYITSLIPSLDRQFLQSNWKRVLHLLIWRCKQSDLVWYCECRERCTHLSCFNPNRGKDLAIVSVSSLVISDISYNGDARVFLGSLEKSY